MSSKGRKSVNLRSISNKRCNSCVLPLLVNSQCTKLPEIVSLLTARNPLVSLNEIMFTSPSSRMSSTRTFGDVGLQGITNGSNWTPMIMLSSWFSTIKLSGSEVDKTKSLIGCSKQNFYSNLTIDENINWRSFASLDFSVEVGFRVIFDRTVEHAVVFADVLGGNWLELEVASVDELVVIRRVYKGVNDGVAITRSENLQIFFRECLSKLSIRNFQTSEIQVTGFSALHSMALSEPTSIVMNESDGSIVGAPPSS